MIFGNACSNSGAAGTSGSSSNASSDGALADTSNYLKVSIANLPNNISINESTSCVINNLNKLYCWGLNSGGTIGLGNLVFVKTPRIVDANESYIKVKVGKQFGCAISSLGKLKCFGDNTYGQAGNGSLSPQLTPVVIDSGNNYSDISLSSFVSCAITTSGILKCWGFNTYGAVGTIAYNTSYQEPRVAVPTVVPIGQTVRLVKTETTHSCAITSDNDLYCWGMNRYIGINQASGVSGLPVHVDSGVKYLDIAVSNSATCGITTTHLLRCWGDGAVNGTGSNSALSPQTIDGGTNYQQIYLGIDTACGITSSQIPKCWGLNDQGQVGVNSAASSISVPTPLFDQNSLSEIKIYNRHACGINSLGKLLCWGVNSYGQAGTNSSNQLYRLPMLTETNASFINVIVHQNHSCGIRSVDGVVYCWGSNAVAQAGLGATYEMVSSPMPLQL